MESQLQLRRRCAARGRGAGRPGAREGRHALAELVVGALVRERSDLELLDQRSGGGAARMMHREQVSRVGQPLLSERPLAQRRRPASRRAGRGQTRVLWPLALLLPRGFERRLEPARVDAEGGKPLSWGLPRRAERDGDHALCRSLRGIDNRWTGLGVTPGQLPSARWRPSLWARCLCGRGTRGRGRPANAPPLPCLSR